MIRTNIKRIYQDPALSLGLMIVIIFVVVGVIWPLFAMLGESVSEEGQPLFEKYLTRADPK